MEVGGVLAPGAINRIGLNQFQLGERILVEVVRKIGEGEGTVRVKGQEVSALLETSTQAGERFWVKVTDVKDGILLLVREPSAGKQGGLPEVPQQIQQLAERGLPNNQEIITLLKAFSIDKQGILTSLFETIPEMTAGTVQGTTPGTTTQETTQGTVQGTTPGTTTQETTQGTVQGTTPGTTTQETTQGTVQGTTPGTTTQETTQGTTPGTTQETTQGTVQGATPGTTQETTPGTVQGTTPGTTQETTQGTVQRTTPGTTTQETTQGTVQGTTPGTVQGATPGTTQETTPGTVQGTTPGTVQGTTPGTVQGTTPGTVQGTTPGTVQGTTPGTVQGTTPGTTPGTVQATAPGTTQGTTPGTVPEATTGTASETSQKTVQEITSGSILKTDLMSLVGTNPATKTNSRTITDEFMIKLQSTIPEWSGLSEENGAEKIVECLRKLGLNYEQRIMQLMKFDSAAKEAEINSLKETVKFALLETAQNKEGKELGSDSPLAQLLQKITGQQLWLKTGALDNAFILLQLPLLNQGQPMPVHMAIESARKGTKMDDQHCRIALQIETELLGDVGIDAFFNQDSVTLRVLTRDHQLLPLLIEEVLPETKAKFARLGFNLANVETGDLDQNREFHSFLQGIRRSGVDVKG